ncbi:hypothetical protein D1872_178420 [compost metagenome]
MSENFKNGDWITARIEGNNFIRGFVLNVLHNEFQLRIRIVETENEGVIPCDRVWNLKIPMTRCKKINEVHLHEEGYIRNLIDIALQERNMEQFMELSYALRVMIGIEEHQYEEIT